MIQSRIFSEKPSIRRQSPWIRDWDEVLRQLDRYPWATLMPPPQRIPQDLVDEGRAIPVARVQAMHEGKRRVRAKRSAIRRFVASVSFFSQIGAPFPVRLTPIRGY